MSTAETKIEQFIQEPNTVEALAVSPEHAQAAGRAFTELCDDEMLSNAGSVRSIMLAGGYATAHMDKASFYQDGSKLLATISSRSGRLPEGHIDKAMGVKDDPYEIRVRSWVAQGNDLFVQESEYTLDEASGTVKKKLHQPVDDIKRVLNIARIAEVESPEGEQNAAAEEALLADMENALQGQELEREMGIDEHILVGPTEIQKLRTLLAGMAAAS
jgi:hypothetical protein